MHCLAEKGMQNGKENGKKIVLRIKLEFGIIKAVLQQCSVPGNWLSSLADRKNIPNLVPSVSHLTAPYIRDFEQG